MIKKQEPNSKDFQDSDLDGLLDNVEKRYGTDPTKPDSDSDNLNDFQEINVYGTNPNNSDTDRDGMSDGEEVKVGRNPVGAGSLKDFFVPHAGNNFEPKALSPYRLLFYGLSSVFVKLFVIFIIIMFPLSALLVPDILADQSRRVIELTNEVRVKSGVVALKENPKLTLSATKKAQDMMIDKYFSHTAKHGETVADWLRQSGYPYEVAGENLAMGFANPEEVVSAWSKSKTHYANMIDPDFTEVGVGMAVGPYMNEDTTFVAQHFGRQSLIDEQEATTTEDQSEEARIKREQGKNPIPRPTTTPQILGHKVLGEKISGPDLSIDTARSKIYVEDPIGQDQRIVKVEAYLGVGVKKASVDFGGYNIELAPASEAGLWTGQALLFKKTSDQLFNPVVLANITVSDGLGRSRIVDLDWGSVVRVKPSLWRQYMFTKQYGSEELGNMFLVASLYYKTLLGVALVALGFYTLIEIRKKKPHIVFSSLAFILLLIILILL